LRDTARILGADLWASEANVIWVAYWVIAYQLHELDGLAPLVTEVDASRQRWMETHPADDLLNDADAAYNWISSATLPLLGATIQEVLRLCTHVVSKRRVMQPATIGGYTLLAGETVLMVTRAVHLDEDIHPHPERFLPARYIITGDNKKFQKDGRPVPNHSMPWGGGSSMCEGRYAPTHPSLVDVIG
jgi:cytochrome P450